VLCFIDSNKKLIDALSEFSGDVEFCKHQDEVRQPLVLFVNTVEYFVLLLLNIFFFSAALTLYWHLR